MSWDFLAGSPFWALVGVIVGSALTTLKDVYLDHRKQSRDGRYAALRLVAIFELYAEACLEVARDDGETVLTENGWDERVPAVDRPLLGTLPQDIDWKALDVDLTYRVLRFPVRIAECERSIQFMFSEVAAPPDYDEGFEERQIRYAELGLEARKLADDLRRTHKLPTEEAEGPIDALGALATGINKAREQRRVTQASATSLFDEKVP
ncbi:hypothetical protein [Phreatobacter oligotrophus]|uniref:Uncharacterized protein n=1 Tax=Phreatobacter oligotrophus TaxID=1122261 RepID=A0A2T4ZDY4_9HYPH|nr:hypothetical protein [Phreatobacter oligotrophus]PTM60085.1 hypothetical protein C8P69_1039 [Phreatobacter oligotrophus]